MATLQYAVLDAFTYNCLLLGCIEQQENVWSNIIYAAASNK